MARSCAEGVIPSFIACHSNFSNSEKGTSPHGRHQESQHTRASHPTLPAFASIRQKQGRYTLQEVVTSTRTTAAERKTIDCTPQKAIHMSDTNNSNKQLDAGSPPSIPSLQDAIARSKSISEKGHAQDQNTLSFARGPEAEAARPTVAKPVDSRTIVGSYPGDHRANANSVATPANPGPREGMRQESLNSKLADNAPDTVQNWGGSADSDAGN